MSRGVLHLVVGPSGVGKDMLIDAARAARPDIHFPARWVTRGADAGGETHVAVEDAAFEAMAAQDRFALWWRAHGLGYGVPAEIGEALAGGSHVVVNGSRGVVAEARARFAPLRVLHVVAPESVIAARLGARGRESASAVAERLARAAPPPQGDDVWTIDNCGPREAGVAAFLAALAPPPPSAGRA